MNTTSDIDDERNRLMTETNELEKTGIFENDKKCDRIQSSQHGDAYVTGETNQLNFDGIYTYTYDDRNMQTQTAIATGIVEEFEWDYRNRLTSIITRDATGAIAHQVNYVYDVMGRRIAKTIDADGDGSEEATTTHFIYDGNNVLMEFVDDSTTPSQRYLHGPQIDQILAQDNGTGQPQWLLADHLGTVHDVIDNNGTVLNHITFDSFGTVLNQTDDTFSTRYLFTGREFDDETGLYYYRARYYNSEIGRFISQDPISFRGGDTNLYSYVANNPTNFIDPSGKVPVAVPVALLVLAAGCGVGIGIRYSAGSEVAERTITAVTFLGITIGLTGLSSGNLYLSVPGAVLTAFSTAMSRCSNQHYPHAELPSCQTA